MNILIIIALCSILCAILLDGAYSCIILFLALLIVIHSIKKTNKLLIKYSITFFVCFFLMSLRMLSISDVQLNIGSNYEVSGRVVEIVSSKPDYQSFIFETTKINGLKSENDLLISNQVMELQENSELVIDIIVDEMNYNKNFDMFNYRDYLRAQGIYNHAELKDVKNIKNDISIIETLRLKQVEYIEDTIDENLDRAEADLIKRLLLSKKIEDENTYEIQYRDFGLAHILAVSGLHISIIAGFLMLLLSNFRCKYKYKVSLVLIMLIWYSYLLKFPASTIRAIIMFGIAQLAIILKRKNNIANSICITAIMMLIFNPNWIYQMSFQLSFAAVISITILKRHIDVFLHPVIGDDRLGISTFISVNLGLFPIQMLYFNEFNIWSLFANILLIPIITAVLLLSIIGIALNIFKIKLIVQSLFLVISLLLKISKTFLDLLGLLPLQKLSIGNPNIYFLFIYYCILAFILKYKYILSRKTMRICTYIFFAILIGNTINIRDDALHIEFLDVGQGDSILISQGEHNILIDTGGNIYGDYNPGEEITCKAIRDRGIKLDIMFLTHYDLDHSNGTECLINSNLINSFGLPYANNKSEIYNKIMDSGISVYKLNEGDNIELGDIRINILNPNNNNLSSNSNDNSLVLNLEFNGKKILFTGDISSVVENDIMGKLEHVDLLKVAHHGSLKSSSEDFLNTITPEYAIISVGANNSYGHPNREVIDRLENINSKILRSDEEGAIRFTIDDDIIYETYENRYKLDYDLIIYILFSILFNYVLIVLIKRKDTMIDESLRLLQ